MSLEPQEILSLALPAAIVPAGPYGWPTGEPQRGVATRQEPIC